MKTLSTSIAFAAGMVLTTQAFAAESSDCLRIVWNNGHYVCGIVEND